jgi:hypothetical protein
MKIYLKPRLKQKQMLRCSMQNEIVDCLKSVLPQEKKSEVRFFTLLVVQCGSASAYVSFYNFYTLHWP